MIEKAECPPKQTAVEGVMRPAQIVDYMGFRIRIVTCGTVRLGWTWTISIHKDRWTNPVHVATEPEPFRDPTLAHLNAVEAAKRWIDESGVELSPWPLGGSKVEYKGYRIKVGIYPDRDRTNRTYHAEYIIRTGDKEVFVGATADGFQTSAEPEREAYRLARRCIDQQH